MIQVLDEAVLLRNLSASLIAMRIREVLRDDQILAMQPGSRERILATARKNLDRLVNTGSMLKVMGLASNDRVTLLQTLEQHEFSIWLLNDNEQHLIFISDSDQHEMDGYRWK